MQLAITSCFKLSSVNFMKVYSGSLSIVFFILMTACSTPETTIEPDVAVVEPDAPDWYNPALTSKTDSLSFQGFSMASAADSTEALQLGSETAISNLRFEIDSYLENIRRDLADETSEPRYQQPSFIIELRNLVQDLDLSDSDVTVFFEPDSDEVWYVYTRAEVSRELIYREIERTRFDDRFVENIRESFE